MLRRLSALILLMAVLIMPSCSPSGSGAGPGEAPLVLAAVPSDALFVGVSPRFDRALEALDSASVLRSLDYGKLSRSAGAVALCDIGSIVPLAIIDLGRHAPDTAAHVASLLAEADTLKLFSGIVGLGEDDVCLLTPSETVMTIALRHVAAETSILDAPGFGRVVQVLRSHDARIYRNRGLSKLPVPLLAGLPVRRQMSFLEGASEWTVISGERLIPVQPEGGSYFCNYFAPVQEAPSRLRAVLPQDADSVVDMPVGSVEEFRKGYESWLDAKVALEAYKGRISALKKASGKSPLNWEKEQNVQEVAYVHFGEHTLNMVRVARSSDGGDIQPNAYTGFVNALYGNMFEADDDCCMQKGEWIISGQRQALESYLPPEGKGVKWPAKAKLVLDTGGMRLEWTKDEIKIWDSNR